MLYITNTQDMSNTSETETSVCANCGKGEEESDNLKTCTACKLVKYCSRECQIAHRPQHKRECKKRAAELHDEQLFKQPPPLEDCPICFQRLPYLESGRTYMACCGKRICSGCVYAVRSRAVSAGRQKEDDICPFCRTPPTSSFDKAIKRLEKRMELNDYRAIYNLGCYYSNGRNGLPQNMAKALELFHRAAELGDVESYNNIGFCYQHGRGVEVDKKKAVHYLELGALGGDPCARHKLGVVEGKVGNYDRALKHLMIAVKDGSTDSLEIIKVMYETRYATKDDYARSLHSYQAT